MAGDFYTNLIDRDEYIDYFELIHKLEKRFNYQDLPETLQIHFMSARQNPSYFKPCGMSINLCLG
jgi:hypothetical protein